MNTICLTALLAVMLANALPVLAQVEVPKPAENTAQTQTPPFYLINPFFLERLKLNEEQKNKYVVIEKEFLEKKKSLGISDDALRKAVSALNAAQSEAEPAKVSAARIKLAAERESYRQQAEPLRQLRNQFLAQFVQILTPEQAKIFDRSGKRSDPDKAADPKLAPPRN